MKLILLLIILLFTSGCYDYKEINDLAIISAMGLDYKNDEYEITIEALNDNIDKDSSKIKSYISVGTGKTITKALENAADKLDTEANYSHLKLMVLSDSIIKEKLDDTVDFFLRSTYFRENFYVISSIQDDPKKILDNTTDEKPVSSDAIIKMLESIKYISNSTITKKFEQVVEEILTFGIDTSFTNIKLEDKNFIIDGMVVFDNYKYMGKLDNEDAIIYNIFKNDFYRPTYSKEYDNKFFTVSITTGKIGAKIEKDKIKIDGDLNAKIIDNEPFFDIRNLDTLKKINKDFTKILNDNIKIFLKKCQNYHSDILGIAKNYYHKTRIKKEDLWENLDIESNITFKINKKGLIYEVPHEN